jgi:hypothetical protein
MLVILSSVQDAATKTSEYARLKDRADILLFRPADVFSFSRDPGGVTTEKWPPGRAGLGQARSRAFGRYPYEYAFVTWSKARWSRRNYS